MRIIKTIRRYGWRGSLARAPQKIRRVYKRLYVKFMKSEYVNTEYGVIMKSNWGDKTFEMCFNGSYGRVLSDILIGMDRNYIFLDIGANQGLYSLIAAKNPVCCHCYAFEPVSATADLLEKNVALNNLSARVSVLRVAISDRAGTSTISISRNHSGVASLNHTVGELVEVVNLTRLQDIKDHIVPKDLPIIVKIDVEGHEETVISEIISCSDIASRIIKIFYEVDERWCDPETLAAPLRDVGFSLERIGTGRHYDVLACRWGGE